jgi:hypothetical protein
LSDEVSEGSLTALCHPLELEQDLKSASPRISVDALLKVCDLFHISKSKAGGANANKQALVKKVLAYIDRNRGQLTAEHLVQTQAPDLGEDSWFDNMRKRPQGGSVMEEMHKHDGVSFEACLPVMAENSTKGKQVWAKNEDGKVMYRAVKGRVGSSLHFDMKARNCALKWGPSKCSDRCHCDIYTSLSDNGPDKDLPQQPGEVDSDAEAAPLGEDDGFVPAAAALPPQAQPGSAVATHTARPERRERIRGAQPKCGKCCPCCNTPSKIFQHGICKAQADCLGIALGPSVQNSYLMKIYNLLW